MKALKLKKSAKDDRERQVLLALIELYQQTGKPIGSNTLKDTAFANLSSATIRNYFAHLDEEDYLTQQHTSGGRIPTAKAFRLYANEYANEIPKQDRSLFKNLRMHETHELAAYLSEAAEQLSELTQMAIFLSAPRFDHDYIVDIKLVNIDLARCLCILITSFGVIQTEVLHIDKKLSSFSTKRIESYFKWRLHSNASDENKPENLTPEEEQLGNQFYKEIMVRYIVSYTNFTDEDIYRTGFSKLLTYPDFENNASLTHCLSLFENMQAIRLLLKDCNKKETLRFWIGEDLAAFSNQPQDCTVITIPYYINKQCVGSVGLLGPARMPYRKLFEIMHQFSESISEALTNSIYKFKITFRQPHQEAIETQLDHSRTMLIENKGAIKNGH